MALRLAGIFLRLGDKWHAATWRALFAGILWLGVGLLYASHVNAPLLFDDIDFFSGSYVADYGANFLPASSRYWPFASFAHQSLLLGHGTAEMRVGNVLLHGLCLLALQALVARLLAARDPSPAPKDVLRRELAALCATLPFAVHPVSVYAVAYLVQRTTLMATLFCLLMWLAVMTALRQGGWRWLGVAVICYYLAVYSKQHAVLAPVVAAGLVLLYWRPGQVVARTQLRQPGLLAMLLALAACGVIAISVTLASASVIGTSYEPLLAYSREGADWHQRVLLLERVHWMSVLTQCGLFFKYLSVWLWPDPGAMSVDMREVLLEDLASPASWLGVAAYLAFGLAALALLWRGRRALHGRSGIIGLGMLVIWGVFGVELATVRLQETFVLYRSYLWMTGLVFVLGAIWDALLARRRAAWLLLAWGAAVIWLAFGAEQRLATFASELSLWDDAVRLDERRGVAIGHVMGEERAYHNRGVARARSGDLAGALADYDVATARNPRYYFAYLSRSIALSQLGRNAEALAEADRALALRPDFSTIYLQRAVVLDKLGRSDESLHELQRACDLGDSTGCYRHHRRTRPDEEFVFRPRGVGP